MAQITLTLDLSHETVDALHTLIDALNGKPGKAAPVNDIKTGKQMSFDDLEASKEKEPKKKAAKPAETKKPEPELGDDPSEVVTLADVRAVALKLSKAGQQAKLKEIFAKYDAEKLSDISEDNYPALMADLEAANG